ncbi:MAG: YdcF family protein, partial [Lentisphaerae bacterium]|nr:YdcF family protein [Lentisphaerota bacterium]
RLVRLALVVLALLGATILGMGWSICAFTTTVPGATADAALVLGSATRRGKPTPIFEARIDHAVTLYRERRVAKILFTGGKSPREPLSNAEVARDYAMAKGVREQDILLEPYSQTTIENLVYAKVIAASNHLATVLIVSDPWHLKRAMIIAETIGLQATPSATPTSRITGFRPSCRFLWHEIVYSLSYMIHGRYQAVRPME